MKYISPGWVATNTLSSQSPGKVAVFITVGKFMWLKTGLSFTLIFFMKLLLHVFTLLNI